MAAESFSQSFHIDMTVPRDCDSQKKPEPLENYNCIHWNYCGPVQSKQHTESKSIKN